MLASLVKASLWKLEWWFYSSHSGREREPPLKQQNNFKPQNIMFAIKNFHTFSNKSVSYPKKVNFKNACFGFRFSRGPPSWIIVTCCGCPIVLTQRAIVLEQYGNPDTSRHRLVILLIVTEEVLTNPGDGTCPTPGCDGSGHVSGQWKTHYRYVLGNLCLHSFVSLALRRL